MTEEYTIREAVPEDAQEFLLFTKLAGAETDNLTFGPEGLPLTIRQEQDHLLHMQEEEHSVFYLAFENGKIIGSAALMGMNRRMSHRAGMAISLLRAQWGKGIGSALLGQLISYAREHGIEIISLEVRCDNDRAIRLYKKFGFQVIGSFPAFFKIGEEYVDFLLMNLDLRQRTDEQDVQG